MQNIVWGYRGLAPYGLGLDEHVLKAVWVNARGCGKIILIARVRHFRMKKPPLVAWTLWKAVKGILGRKRTHSERIVKCAFSFFRIKRFHRPIYWPTPWASRRVLSTRSKAHVHVSEGDMGKCALLVLTNSCRLGSWDTKSEKWALGKFLALIPAIGFFSLSSSSLIFTSAPCSMLHIRDFKYSLTSHPWLSR